MKQRYQRRRDTLGAGVKLVVLSFYILSYFPNSESLVTSILLTLTHAVSPGPGTRARQQQHRHAACKQKGKG